MMKEKSLTKKIGIILLVIGIITLITAILFAFAVGGTVVPVLTISSILINSLAITLIRGKY